MPLLSVTGELSGKHQVEYENSNLGANHSNIMWSKSISAIYDMTEGWLHYLYL